MLFLITGTVGTGKTAFAISKILEYRKKEPTRQIYTNIDGINIPDVISIDHNDYEQFDDGSIFFFDEAQQFLNFKASHEAKDDKITQSLQVSRHRGFDIYFITQHPSFLSKWVTCLINEHFHLVNAMGLKASTLYRFTGVKGSLVNLDVLKDTALDVKRVSFDDSVFSKYKSASMHTKKFTMPKKLKFYIFLVLLIFSGFFYLIYYNYKNATFQKATISKKEIPTKIAPTVPFVSSVQPQNVNNSLNKPTELKTEQKAIIENKEPEPFIVGCMIFEGNAFTYLSNGKKVKIKISDCNEQMQQMPVRFPNVSNYANNQQLHNANTNNIPASSTVATNDNIKRFSYNP